MKKIHLVVLLTLTHLCTLGQGTTPGGTLITVTNANDSGIGSLRNAIETYLVGGGEVHFKEYLNGQTITLSSPIALEKRVVSIDASNLPDGITVSGGGTTGIFEVGDQEYGGGGGLWLVNVRLTNGRAVWGGAISNVDAAVTIIDSTIDNCTATEGGGAIFSLDGRIDIRNSTLYNNRCTGADSLSFSGTIFIDGACEILHTTITGNQGGIFLCSDLGEAVVIRNSVVSGNGVSDVYFEGFQFPGQNLFKSDGNNFIGVGNAIDGSTFNKAGDVTGNSNPMLGSLGDNGGGTPSCLPLPGSPLIDAATGDASGEVSVFWSDLRKDQRGEFRSVGASPDMGAVEVGITLTVTNANDSGAGSLRQVIQDAPNGATVVFDASLSGATIMLTSGELAIDNSLTIDSSSLPRAITVSGGGRSRVFNIGENGDVIFKSLEIIDGFVSWAGAGIYCEGGRIELYNCTIAYCRAIAERGDPGIEYDPGGGILLHKASASLTNCTLYGNYSGRWGAAIHCSNLSLLLLHHCTITGNGSVGVQVDGSSAEVLNSIVAGNGGLDWGTVGFSSVDSFGNNIIGMGDASSLEDFSEDGDVTGIGDPMLGPLYDNGGKTRTCLPMPGSPAVDGVNGPFWTLYWGKPILEGDQRGLLRPRGDYPDCGAVEFQLGDSQAAGLLLEIGPTVFSERHGKGTGTVKRTTGSSALTVSLTNPNPSVLVMPLSVVIPAGQQSAEFEFNLIDNDLEDGDELLTLTATASGYASAEDYLTKMDDDQYILVTNTNTSGPGSFSQALDDVERYRRIRFDPGLSGGIISGYFSPSVFYRDVIIDASDLPSGITFHATGQFWIYASRVEMHNITVSGNSVRTTATGDGYVGIGIRADFSTLILQDSTIEDNHGFKGFNASYLKGAGIYAATSELFVRDSIIANNTISSDPPERETAAAAGIYGGAITIERSAIYGNTAPTGAAILGGLVRIFNSTISDNTSLGEGSVVSVVGGTIDHSTLSGNTSNNTLSVNSDLVIGNTIVSGNTGTDFNLGQSTQVNSLGYNIIGTGTAVASFTSGGDMTGVTDPLLGVLSDNGGSTLTMGLLPGSPAIDAADPAGNLGVDQRGLGRPVGSASDIGSFELQPGEVVAPTEWAGYPRRPDGYVDTESWLGWIWVNDASDFVWSVNLGKYLYLPAGFVGESGAWIYFLK